jgi:hypothetical protein
MQNQKYRIRYEASIANGFQRRAAIKNSRTITAQHRSFNCKHFDEKLASRWLILGKALSFTARQISVASKLQCFRIVTQTIERNVGKTSQGAFD